MDSTYTTADQHYTTLLHVLEKNNLQSISFRSIALYIIQAWSTCVYITGCLQSHVVSSPQTGRELLNTACTEIRASGSGVHQERWATEGQTDTSPAHPGVLWAHRGPPGSPVSPIGLPACGSTWIMQHNIIWLLLLFLRNSTLVILHRFN